MKTLVIYYSREGENYVGGSIKSIPKGNTEIIAEMIGKSINADLFKVETVKEYDKSYMVCIEEAKKELQENARPELKKYLENIDTYDNIIIAGPCWWGTYPMAILSLIERLDFSGKRVFPLMTHEGSGLSGAPAALKKYCRGATVGKGLAIHGADAVNSEKEVGKWLKEINL